MTLTVTADEARSLDVAPGKPNFSLLRRVGGAVWFGLLALIYARITWNAVDAAVQQQTNLGAWARVAGLGLTGGFYGILGWLMITRPAARAARNGIWPNLVALAGTYGVWLMVLLPMDTPSPMRAALGSILTLLGGAAIIYCVAHLGKAFSISPQARLLVTTGPYRFVRNPLYLAEAVAIFGMLLQFKWWIALPFFVVHLTLQIRRMLFEETVLAATFEEYAAYARRTARLIPGVW